MGEGLTTIIQKHVLIFNIKKILYPMPTPCLFKLVTKLFSLIELVLSYDLCAKLRY